MTGFSNPARNLENFAVRKGMMVADFGAGSGAYAFQLAKMVLPDGMVYAVDVQQKLVDRLVAEGRDRGLGNLRGITGNLDRVGGSTLADNSVDFVLVANILFQSDAPYLLAKEAERVLRPGGQIAVIDWTDSFGHLGPHPDRVVIKSKAREIFTAAGLIADKEFPAGDHHYGLLFSKLKTP